MHVLLWINGDGQLTVSYFQVSFVTTNWVDVGEKVYNNLSSGLKPETRKHQGVGASIPHRVRISIFKIE